MAFDKNQINNLLAFIIVIKHLRLFLLPRKLIVST